VKTLNNGETLSKKDNPVPSMSIEESVRMLIREVDETGVLSYTTAHYAVTASYLHGVETNKVQPIVYNQNCPNCASWVDDTGVCESCDMEYTR
jgi:hypothetical protein